ncbi:hypothetical protein GCM10023115_04330 [Pontixanthobacter gangjinensis]|uniref:Response regulator n=1 Tax=Pontixanthobacter gangjinensis TaxID=1028742 RepID=A0A6I4SLJ1_9SPHN|nr:response regulator [Pontixanthobacter gangjinensis]
MGRAQTKTQSPQATCESLPSQGFAPRVLLAEDNPIVGELMSMVARRTGIHLVHADNGQEAYEMILAKKAQGEPFTLLLADAMMPVLGGVELTRRLRAHGFSPEELPIIAVTAATAQDELREYMQAGMQAYLAKPVSLADFSATIEAWNPSEVRHVLAPNQPLSASLRLRYKLRKAETIEILEAAAKAKEPDIAAISQVRHMLHRLAGTAGSFGEQDLSRASARCETMLIEATPDEFGLRLQECLKLMNEAGLAS